MGRMKDDTMEPVDPTCDDCGTPLDDENECVNEKCLEGVEARERLDEATRLKLFAVDTWEDRTKPIFSTYFVRSFSKRGAKDAVKKLKMGFDKIRAEEVVEACQDMHPNLAQNSPVLFREYQNQEAGFIR